MEIKNLSNATAGQLPESRSGDLLARLQSAGSIEAEVARNIEGRLLLNTRLGEILTSNTLNFKPGDKIVLRLEGGDQNPVLKASLRNPGLITIESSRNPDLSRLLSPAKTLLAVVTRIDAAQTIIRLAGQSLTLPRLDGVKQDQLLNLQQDPRGRLIEIAPLERRLIYQSLLKQLLPAQAELKPTGLVKLLNLVSGTKNEAAPAVVTKGANENTIARLSTDKPPATPAPSSAGNKPTADQLISRTNLATTNPGVTTPEGPAITPATGSEKYRPDSGAAPTAGSDQNRQKTSSDRPEINAILRHISRVATNNATVIKPAAGTGVAADDNPVTRDGAPSPASATHSRKTALPGIAIGLAAAGPGGAGLSNTILSGNTPPGAHTGATSQSNAAAAAEPSAASTLQRLLLLVPGIAKADVSQIRQWFEFAQLIRSPQHEAGTALPGNTLQLLKQMADPEAFRRELGQFIRGKSQPGPAKESAMLKSAADEAMSQNIRDGVKLIEQALSQNLLQRASLGLQQESQLPVSLSFALPILEQQSIKPLTIEIDQRDQSSEEVESSWDIRLNFEFDELGPVASHIFLEGSSIAISFYAEHRHTCDRIEQALPMLQQQLVSAGFNARELRSFNGLPRTDNAQKSSRYSDALVDIEV